MFLDTMINIYKRHIERKYSLMMGINVCCSISITFNRVADIDCDWNTRQTSEAKHDETKTPSLHVDEFISQRNNCGITCITGISNISDISI